MVLQGCEMAVACHYLWAGRFKATEMQSLSSASLFRISQARHPERPWSASLHLEHGCGL